MGVVQMEQNQLEQIGEYVKQHIDLWIKEKNLESLNSRENILGKELLERTIRIEEALKFQGEKFE